MSVILYFLFLLALLYMMYWFECSRSIDEIETNNNMEVIREMIKQRDETNEKINEITHLLKTREENYRFEQINKID